MEKKKKSPILEYSALYLRHHSSLSPLPPLSAVCEYITKKEIRRQCVNSLVHHCPLDGSGNSGNESNGRHAVKGVGVQKKEKRKRENPSPAVKIFTEETAEPSAELLCSHLFGD